MKISIKQYAFNAEVSFIKKLNSFIKENKPKYKDRTQFILQAIGEKMKREEDNHGY